jgi:hypothetical protein
MNEIRDDWLHETRMVEIDKRMEEIDKRMEEFETEMQRDIEELEEKRNGRVSQS